MVITTGLLGHEPISIPDDRWEAVLRDVVLGTTRTVEAALPVALACRSHLATQA